jgi:hypothetical protein
VKNSSDILKNNKGANICVVGKVLEKIMAENPPNLVKDNKPKDSQN